MNKTLNECPWELNIYSLHFPVGNGKEDYHYDILQTLTEVQKKESDYRDYCASQFGSASVVFW